MTKWETYITSTSSKIPMRRLAEQIGEPKPQFFKLACFTHNEMSEGAFKKYCADRKIVECDKEDFFKILEFFALADKENIYGNYFTLNRHIQKQYGFRYIGYQYMFDWRTISAPARYTYYFRIDRIKKFNYARIKIGF